jgi:hypothetical protein
MFRIFLAGLAVLCLAMVVSLTAEEPESRRAGRDVER